MKKGRQAVQAAARRLDIPEQIAAGLPAMEIAGFSKITVEKQKGLLAYSEEEIVLKVCLGAVRITGRRLEILEMNSQSVSVGGQLEAVRFEENGLCGQ